MSGAIFTHELLFYASDEEFLAGTMPLVGEAIEAGAPSLIAVADDKIELLRGELGGDADEAEFLEMEAVGRNPARIITVWQDFIDRTANSISPVLGIGEPVWPGRGAAELDECGRHESLLNLAFDGDREWTLLCPYDSAALDDDVLQAARKCHPSVRSGGALTKNSAWRGSLGGYSPFGGKLSKSPDRVKPLGFRRESLATVRKLIAAEATRASLSGDRRAALAIAVNELAINSVLHGGGAGTLRVWREQGTLLVEVSDSGWIEEPLVGRVRPQPAEECGRGLWMVNQLCDLVQIRSSPGGTHVRIHIDLS